MAKAPKKAKKTVSVREHPRPTPVSTKNPNGIKSAAMLYPRQGLMYPAEKKLKFPDADKYDETIAIWTDYFNKKFSDQAPLDPDVVKALIASESNFEADPKENSKTIGIAQITDETYDALLDPKGEVKDFIFTNVRKKDLKNPDIAIPMAVRWLFRKKRLAEGRLGRTITPDELILEYKGLLKSDSTYKEKALKNFRTNYAKLKRK